jgi:hypothetical protein
MKDGNPVFRVRDGSSLYKGFLSYFVWAKFPRIYSLAFRPGKLTPK